MDASLESQPTASPLAAGVAALRRFWRPFLLIQTAAVALGLAYRFSGTVRAACVALADWKTAGGRPFAAVTGAVAGGVLPEIAKILAGGAGARRRLGPAQMGSLAFNIGFFAVNGVVIDGLYRTEARIFGDDARPATVIAKTAFDQLAFSPVWLIVIVLLFLWRQRGFSWAATRPALRDGFYRARVLPLLLPNWCFWTPIVLIVYALPGPLQFLMFCFALAAWSLIMVFIAGAGQGAEHR